MAEQNFKNHSQIVYGYYLSTGVPILLLIGFSLKYLVAGDIDPRIAALLLLTGWILLSMLFRSRGFALRAQDRAIRAEEGLRYYQLTQRRLDPSLSIGQVIALRFASDAEMPALAERALREGLSNRQIKALIQHWRADTYRV